MEGCSNTIHTRVQGVNLMNEYMECASLQDVGGVCTDVCAACVWISMRLHRSARSLRVFPMHTRTVEFHYGSLTTAPCGVSVGQ